MFGLDDLLAENSFPKMLLAAYQILSGPVHQPANVTLVSLSFTDPWTVFCAQFTWLTETYLLLSRVSDPLGG